MQLDAIKRWYHVKPISEVTIADPVLGGKAARPQGRKAAIFSSCPRWDYFITFSQDLENNILSWWEKLASMTV